MHFLLAIFISVFSFFSSTPFVESDADKTARFLPRIASPLPVKFALPEKFVISGPDVIAGVFWGYPDVIKQAIELSKKGRVFNADHGVFKVDISATTSQTGPADFSFGSDVELRKDVLALDKHVSDLHISRTSWGPYPIVAVTFKNSLKRLACLAWVGLNSNSQVLRIVYMTGDKKKVDEDLAIWNKFITETKLLQGYEYYKALGYEFKPGSVTFTRTKGKIRCTSQQKEGEKPVITIEVLSRNTKFNLLSTDIRDIVQKVEDQSHKCLSVHLYIDSDVDYVHSAGEVIFPIFPQKVSRITLKGKKIYEDENCIVLKR